MIVYWIATGALTVVAVVAGYMIGWRHCYKTKVEDNDAIAHQFIGSWVTDTMQLANVKSVYFVHDLDDPTQIHGRVDYYDPYLFQEF